MRERWAKRLAALTGLIVLLASAAFAAVQNPGSPAPPNTAPTATASPPAAAPNSETLTRGRAVFDAQDCARCHSIAGQGSPRNPLDGVGAALSRDELRQWVIGDDAIKDDLSPRALTAKQGYGKLPAAELDALVEYLASLR